MQDSLQIFTASSGKPSARVIGADGTVRHLHSTVKPEAEADYFSDLTFWGNIIVLAGVGLGYHLGETINKIPQSAILILIDYYDELLKRTCTNLFAPLSNEIITITPHHTEKEKNDVLNRIKGITVLYIQIIKHPASYILHKDFYEDILSPFTAVIPRKHRKKTSPEKGLVLSGKFFLQEECCRALQQITKEEPAVLNYEKINSDLSYESQLQYRIQKEKPDFILSINMKGFDGSGILSTTALRFDIPVIVWFVDDPHPILLSKSKYVTHQMIACCWEKAYIPFLEEKGFQKVIYLPLATDPALFSQAPLQSPQIPLGFIGTSMGSTFLADIRNKFLWSDSLTSLVDKASDILLDKVTTNLSEIINSCVQEVGVTLPFSDDCNMTWLRSYIIHMASMKKRKRIISALIPMGIELFGDPEGWKDLLGGQIKTHPDLDYATQLCTSYRNIAVNLNITSCQMPSAVNQRVFDIPMAGSLVLSDNQKDLEELFTIGTEAVCYNDIDELKEKITYYSTHANARSDIVSQAQKRIEKEHTYTHRIKNMIHTLHAL